MPDQGVSAALPPAPSSDVVLAGHLASDLSAAGFTVDGVAELLGPVAYGAMSRGHRAPAEVATRASVEPLAGLVRLWILGVPVGVPLLQRALPGIGLQGLLVLGVARLGPADGQMMGTVDLRPYGDADHGWWVVSDLTSMATGVPLAPDHVVGVGGASATLASWAPRPMVQRALDLGTGSGVQALHLADHAAYRVATDISERALRFARLTAALNGIEVDCRGGSAFDPVEGEEFDLLVCNPPFVITPRTSESAALSYRDAGARGDEFLAGLISRTREHLAPGGIATYLGNWEVMAGRTWSQRIAEWLDNAGLDALVVQRGEQDPSEYAETWGRDAGVPAGDMAFEQSHAASIEDFAARDVQRIGLGIVVLQRPAEDRPTWQHFVDARVATEQPMGPHVLAHVRARSWLAMHSDEEVLSVVWTVAPVVTQEQIGVPGALDPSSIRLRQAGGFAHVAQVDTLVAAVVGACDGELSARQIVVAVAALLDVDTDQALTQAVIALRELVAFGLLR
ncbi:MAG: methyltransferase [Ornithinimicrobium sp.]